MVIYNTEKHPSEAHAEFRSPLDPAFRSQAWICFQQLKGNSRKIDLGQFSHLFMGFFSCFLRQETVQKTCTAKCPSTDKSVQTHHLLRATVPKASRDSPAPLTAIHLAWLGLLFTHIYKALNDFFLKSWRPLIASTNCSLAFSHGYFSVSPKCPT